MDINTTFIFILNVFNVLILSRILGEILCTALRVL